MEQILNLFANAQTDQCRDPLCSVVSRFLLYDYYFLIRCLFLHTMMVAVGNFSRYLSKRFSVFCTRKRRRKFPFLTLLSVVVSLSLLSTSLLLFIVHLAPLDDVHLVFEPYVKAHERHLHRWSWTRLQREDLCEGWALPTSTWLGLTARQRRTRDFLFKKRANSIHCDCFQCLPPLALNKGGKRGGGGGGEVPYTKGKKKEKSAVV